MLKPAKVRVSAWEEAKALGGHLTNWIFRGQANADWTLISTIERALSPGAAASVAGTELLDAIFGNRRREIEGLERVLLREFQRRAHLTIQDFPGDDELLDWFSLMQHYGCVTRLLDFSRSFYVAAYFAVEAPSSSGVSAIWCVEPSMLYPFEGAFTDDKYEVGPMQRKVASQVLGGEVSAKGVVAAEPFRLAERVAAQQGLHLIGCDPAVPFENNLCAQFGTDAISLDQLDWQGLAPGQLMEPDEWGTCVLPGGLVSTRHFGAWILKIELPEEVHRSALHDLNAMNVTAASLFPGLAGFARSLNVHARFPSLHEIATEARARRRTLKQGEESS